ncbi:MAG: pirin family protein [Bacteroidia bacterium]|nr:pirin family protein [Bacteroidia bacterium]
MKTIIHRSNERGHANHGWLNAKHSFSFASWYDPSKIHFGALRVLNDDEVAAGMGFGKHPHDNMEIITLVQEGALEHKDSMGNGSVMRANDVQVMSAGSGVFHSEMNHSKDEAVKLFQIWVFPNKGNVTPRYDQRTYLPEGRNNTWQEIIKPEIQAEGDGIFIHQQAWFNLADLSSGQTLPYTIHQNGNGLYLFVIDGEVTVDGTKIGKRDAIGITEATTVNITATANARLLAIDVPMIELH